MTQMTPSAQSRESPAHPQLQISPHLGHKGDGSSLAPVAYQFFSIRQSTSLRQRCKRLLWPIHSTPLPSFRRHRRYFRHLSSVLHPVTRSMSLLCSSWNWTNTPCSLSKLNHQDPLPWTLNARRRMIKCATTSALFAIGRYAQSSWYQCIRHSPGLLWIRVRNRTAHSACDCTLSSIP
jgi:hypothetical protein